MLIKEIISEVQVTYKPRSRLGSVPTEPQAQTVTQPQPKIRTVTKQTVDHGSAVAPKDRLSRDNDRIDAAIKKINDAKNLLDKFVKNGDKYFNDFAKIAEVDPASLKKLDNEYYYGATSKVPMADRVEGLLNAYLGKIETVNDMIRHSARYPALTTKR